MNALLKSSDVPAAVTRMFRRTLSLSAHAKGLTSASYMSEHRALLKNCNRVVVKLGSAVITRGDECGIALGRLASIVEQISELQNSGKQMLMVTSGAVAFGKQNLLKSSMMSRSFRQTVGDKQNRKPIQIDARACAASGQSGLMALYNAMFSQYGISTAQVLVKKTDFYNEYTRKNLQATLRELLNLRIVPILNTNDAIASSPEIDLDIQGVISIKDNDSLAARLAVLIQSDFLLIMSDVDGIYNKPPSEQGSHLLSTYNPSANYQISFGQKSNVGTGGMQSKIEAASWALAKDCSVVICNGELENAIVDTLAGKNIGTFFTKAQVADSARVEQQALQAREGGSQLQQLSAQLRSRIVLDFAAKIKDSLYDILEANAIDIRKAKEKNLRSRAFLDALSLNNQKIDSLIRSMQRIAGNSDILGKNIRCRKLADDIVLQEMTVPLGVLLFILESRPDNLPFMCSLAISSGNGLLLKCGSEASQTNALFHKLCQEAISKHIPAETISLLSDCAELNDLLKLDARHIDLIIPRGSNKLVKYVKEMSKSIPVLGNAVEACSIYIDKKCDPKTAIQIVQDSKCSHLSAWDGLSTLLVHKDHIKSELLNDLIEMLMDKNVKLYSGPLFNKLVRFSPPVKACTSEDNSDSLDQELTVELVQDVNEAIAYINNNGSKFADCIVTTDEEVADEFLRKVDSACVLKNVSSELVDGNRFGLGAEVAIGTNKIHARGPIGVGSLLTCKWLMYGKGSTVGEFASGGKKLVQQPLDDIWLKHMVA